MNRKGGILREKQGQWCGLRNFLSHWTVGTCISLCQLVKQITKKAAGPLCRCLSDVQVRSPPSSFKD